MGAMDKGLPVTYEVTGKKVLGVSFLFILYGAWTQVKRKKKRRLH